MRNKIKAKEQATLTKNLNVSMEDYLQIATCIRLMVFFTAKGQGINETKAHSKKTKAGIETVTLPRHLVSDVIHVISNVLSKNSPEWEKIPVNEILAIAQITTAGFEYDKAEMSWNKAIQFMKKEMSSLYTDIFGTHIKEANADHFLSLFFQKTVAIKYLTRELPKEEAKRITVIYNLIIVALHKTSLEYYMNGDVPLYNKTGVQAKLIIFTYAWFFRELRSSEDISDLFLTTIIGTVQRAINRIKSNQKSIRKS